MSIPYQRAIKKLYKALQYLFPLSQLILKKDNAITNVYIRISTIFVHTCIIKSFDT